MLTTELEKEEFRKHQMFHIKFDKRLQDASLVTKLKKLSVK